MGRRILAVGADHRRGVVTDRLARQARVIVHDGVGPIGERAGGVGGPVGLVVVVFVGDRDALIGAVQAALERDAVVGGMRDQRRVLMGDQRAVAGEEVPQVRHLLQVTGDVEVVPGVVHVVEHHVNDVLDLPPAPSVQPACPASRRAAARPTPAEGQAAAPAVAVTPTARALAASSVSGLKNLVPSIRSPPVRGGIRHGRPRASQTLAGNVPGNSPRRTAEPHPSGRLRGPTIRLLPSPRSRLPLPWPASGAANVLPPAQSGPATLRNRCPACVRRPRRSPLAIPRSPEITADVNQCSLPLSMHELARCVPELTLQRRTRRGASARSAQTSQHLVRIEVTTPLAATDRVHSPRTPSLRRTPVRAR